MDEVNVDWVKTMKASRKNVAGHVELHSDPAQAFEVHRNLWIGTAPPIGDAVARYFDCLVLCACEYQAPNCFSNVQVAQAVIDDRNRPMSPSEQVAATRAANQVIRWLNEDLRVLVTCYQGRNRSGLVCGLSLMWGPTKMSSDQAVQTVKRIRENALTNPYFVKFLRACDDSKGLVDQADVDI